ncbi:LysM peptidoglycan-binding domain-containing protein, partial [Pseudomonas sp. EA_35y_Pfl2_R111]|uniref:LysM peptidoglycan-binding domain-containing protein n=1 Tax=Pseudomonas sp. EA_35y_Pfl2_R111 TaxID=3088689 RepID=UPI0030DD9354
DGLNNTLTWTHEDGDFGRLVARKDLGNRVYSYSYNGFGQLTRESLALPPIADSTIWTAGPDKTYNYYSNGLSKAIIEGTLTTNEVGVATAEDSRTSSYEYDQAGNRVREINSARYLAGAISQVSSNETRSRFDEQGRLKGVKAPAGNQLIGALGTQYTLALTARIDFLTYDYDELGNRRRVYLDTTNQAGGRHTIDDWNTYDLEGRALIAEGFRNKKGKIVAGALAHKDVSKLAKGYVMSYDALGRRLLSESWQRAVYTKVTTGGTKGDPKITVNKYTNDSYLRTGYAYNDMGQVTTITAKEFYRAPLADMSSSSSSAGSHEVLYTASYTEQGVRTSNTESTFSWNGASTQRKSRTTTLFTYRGDLQLNSQLLYNDGKLVQGNYFNEANMINAAGQQESYRYVVYKPSSSSIDHLGNSSTTFKLFDSYREDVATVVRTNKGSPGTTTNTYTERGELLHTVGIGGNVFNRKLASNREGQLITRQEASGLTQNYAYHQGTAVANAGNASVPEISDTSTPISALYPARTPGNYVVTQGDTLESIAQALWGDSRMWYLIADANGLAPSAVLTPGDNLKIPNVVSSNHNDATTFKPYNPDDVIGDTTPRTINPAPPPPPKPKKKKCGGIAAAVMVVVAVVVTVFTAGAALTAFAPLAAGAAATAAGATTTLGALAAAGTAALTGGAGLIGMGAAAMGAIAGSAASQLSGMAMGAQDKFSWKQVAASGLTAGIGAGIGSVVTGGSTAADLMKLGGAANYGKVAASAALNYAGGYAANKIVGLDTSFSWSSMAASVAGSYVGGYLGNSLGGKGYPGQLLSGQLSAHTSAAINDKWFGGARPNYGQVAADAFGNTLGNFAVDQMQRAGTSEVTQNRLAAAGDPFGEEAYARYYGMEPGQRSDAALPYEVWRRSQIDNFETSTFDLPYREGGQGASLDGAGLDYLASHRASADSYWLEAQDNAVTEGDAAKYVLAGMMKSLGDFGYGLAEMGVAVWNNPGEGFKGGVRSTTVNLGPEAFNFAVDTVKTSLNGYSLLAETLIAPEGTFAGFRDVNPYHITPLASYDNPAQAGGALIGGLLTGGAVSKFGRYGVTFEDIGRAGGAQRGAVNMRLVRPGDATNSAAAGYKSISEMNLAEGHLKFTDGMNDKAFTKLVKDVQANGLQNKVIQYVDIGGAQYIVVGNNRVMAAQRLGKTDELLFKRVEVPVPNTSFKTFQDVLDASGSVKMPRLR